jgi:hypothetical protein
MLDRWIVLRLTVMLLLAGTAVAGGTIKLPEEANGFGTVKVVVGADYSWTKLTAFGKESDDADGDEKDADEKEGLSAADATALDELLRHVNSSGDKVFLLGSNSSGSGKGRGLLVAGLNDGIGLSGTAVPPGDLAPSTTGVPEPGGTLLVMFGLLLVLRGYYSERRRSMPRQTAGYCAIRPNYLN